MRPSNEQYYTQGWEDYLMGISYDECPNHLTGSDAAAWKEGWIASEIENGTEEF